MKHIDHLGNKHKNLKEMLKFWSISQSLYYKRKAEYETLEEILKPKLRFQRYSIKSTDHEGNSFDSFTKMCKYWDKPLMTVKHRISSGWTLQESLETSEKRFSRKTVTYDPMKYKERIDHKGNQFNSFLELCRYWSKEPYLVRNRLVIGWSLEDALETPLLVRRRR